MPAYVQYGTASSAGIAAWCVIHPFNTLAVRRSLSAASASGAAPGSLTSFVSDIVAKEGVSALYNGLQAGCARQLIYMGSRIGFYETLRDTAEKYRKTDFAQRIVMGAISGGSAAVVSCPMEVTLVRMSNDAALPLAERRGYSSIVDAFGRIFKEEGIFAFWRGCSALVNRCAMVGVAQVATYDEFKGFYRRNLVWARDSPTFNITLSSFSAGLVYSVATMPLEAAKNRMAFQKPDPATGKLPYTGTVQTIATVARVEGAAALFNGFTMYYLRCGGHTVLSFLALEKIRAAYMASQ